MQIGLGRLLLVVLIVWLMSLTTVGLTVVACWSVAQTTASGNTLRSAEIVSGPSAFTLAPSIPLTVHVEPTKIMVPAPVVQIHEAPAPVIQVPKPEATVNLTANVVVEKVEAKSLADEYGVKLPEPRKP
jgi:hypothetical protein